MTGANSSLLGESVFYNGFRITPVKMANYRIFSYVIESFKLPKNRIPDKKILKMSYLRYLIEEYQKTDELIISNFMLVFNLSLDDEQFENLKLVQSNIDGLYYLTCISEKESIIIDEYKFEELRLLMLKINGMSDVDYSISKETEDLINKNRDDMRKMGGNAQMVDIEDMIDSYHVVGKFSYSEIAEEPIYKFFKNIKRLLLVDNWTIYRPLELSGKIKIKHKVEHWLSHVKEDRSYDDSGIPIEKFLSGLDKNKIKNKKEKNR